jgi:hypothetical protein
MIFPVSASIPKGKPRVNLSGFTAIKPTIYWEYVEFRVIVYQIYAQ